MKKKFFHKVFVVLGIFAFISGYSNNNNNDNDYNECKEEGTFQGHSASENQMQKGWFVSSSFIWWKVKQDGLEIAVQIKETSENENEWDLLKMDFDYHAGFKAGIGGNFERDDWQLYFEYTRLHFTDNNHRRISDDVDAFLYNSWNISPDTIMAAYTYAKGTWKFRYNIIDGTLSRPYYIGTKFSVRPNIGLRGGWINQKNKEHYSDFEEEEKENFVSAKSHSWLIGPRFGIDSNWHFGEGFRLFGNAMGSLFYQDFKIKATQTLINDEGASDISRLKKNKEKNLTPNFEACLGLGWGSYFSKDRWHIDLAVQYDFNYFWNQNMMRKLVDSTHFLSLEDRIAGDLFLHGLEVVLKLDF